MISTILSTDDYGCITVARIVYEDVPLIGRIEVWAAKGTGGDGLIRVGYGETAAKAVIDVLQDLESDRPDPGVPDAGTSVTDAIAYLRRSDHDGPDRVPTLEESDLPGNIQAAIYGNRKIEAIKLLRTHSRLSLRSSKFIVDCICMVRGNAW